MDGKQQDLKRRTRKPGKRSVVIFCKKTNADGLSLHQFPADKSVRRQWLAFVRTKREPNSWTPGSGHICSDHFSADSCEGLGAKIAGFGSKEFSNLFLEAIWERVEDPNLNRKGALRFTPSHTWDPALISVPRRLLRESD